MDINKAIKIEIAEEYERIRAENQAKQEKIKIDIYNKIPEIAKIDAKLIAIQQKMIELTLSDKDINARVEDLKLQAEKLIIEKQDLLTKHRYSHDIFADIYTCKECKDTGVVNGKLCKCYHKKFIDKHFENLEMHQKLKTDNFDHFDLNLFSTSDMSEGISPRENIKQIKKHADAFIKNFADNKSPNLYFFGGSGLGKTYMSSCIARELIYNGYNVIYKTFYEIMDIARVYKFDYNQKQAGEKYELLLSADLLIIDDLDANYVNSFSSSELFHILNTRILNYKKLIISSNINSTDLPNAFDERIASRIYGHFITLKFIGEDLRF